MCRVSPSTTRSIPCARRSPIAGRARSTTAPRTHEWGFAPRYDLAAMTTDMLARLSEQARCRAQPMSGGRRCRTNRLTPILRSAALTSCVRRGRAQGRGGRHRSRVLPPADGERGPRFRIEGEGERPFLRMNANSYLGLSLNARGGRRRGGGRAPLWHRAGRGALHQRHLGAARRARAAACRVSRPRGRACCSARPMPRSWACCRR